MRRLRLTRRIRDAALIVLGFAGALCILWTVCAAIFGLHLVSFASGSMDPAYKQGQIALARDAAAAEIQVGDVVTVDRPGQLPITHRVTQVEAIAGESAERLITLKGDANKSADPAPYTVTKVGVLLTPLPGLAEFLRAVRLPWVMGLITLFAATLCISSLWPVKKPDSIHASPAVSASMPVAAHR
jgi:signal peptidase